MRKALFAILILTFIQSFSQNDKIEKLLLEGNNAFEKKDLQTAKQKYETIINLDSINKDALYNLASVELNLSNTDRACKLLNKSYSLGDFGAYDLIIQYCGKLEHSEKMFLVHVDELPQFKYKDQFETLVVNKKGINPNFMKLLKSEVKNSKDLKRIKGKGHLFLNFDINGNLTTKIKGDINQTQSSILNSTLKSMTEYKPATHNGKPVVLQGGGMALPINF